MGATMVEIGIHGKFHNRYVVQVQPVIRHFLGGPLRAERPLLSYQLGQFTSSGRRLQGELLCPLELRFPELKLNVSICNADL